MLRLGYCVRQADRLSRISSTLFSFRPSIFRTSIEGHLFSKRALVRVGGQGMGSQGMSNLDSVQHELKSWPEFFEPVLRRTKILSGPVCGGMNSSPAGTNSLVYSCSASSGLVTPPYCLSTTTVSSQSFSDIHPSGLPAVLGVTQVVNDSSASARARRSLKFCEMGLVEDLTVVLACQAACKRWPAAGWPCIGGGTRPTDLLDLAAKRSHFHGHPALTSGHAPSWAPNGGIKHGISQNA